MEKLQQIEEELARLQTNFKKNPNREYTTAYLDEKSDAVRNLCANFNRYAAQVNDKETIRDNIETAKGLRDGLTAIIEAARSKINNAVITPIDDSDDNGTDGRCDKDYKDDKNDNNDNNDNDEIIQKMANISFKEVEESIEKFDGVSKNTEAWLRRYEAVVANCAWKGV